MARGRCLWLLGGSRGGQPCLCFSGLACPHVPPLLQRGRFGRSPWLGPPGAFLAAPTLVTRWVTTINPPQPKAKIRHLCSVPGAWPRGPPPTSADCCREQCHTGLNWGLLGLGLMEAQMSMAPERANVGLCQDLASFLGTWFWGDCVASVGMSPQWGRHHGRDVTAAGTSPRWGCRPDGDVTAAVPLSPAGR